MENWRKFLLIKEREFRPPPIGKKHNPRTRNATGAMGIFNVLKYDWKGTATLSWAPGFLDRRKPGGRLKIKNPAKGEIDELFREANRIKMAELEIEASDVVVKKNIKGSELLLIENNSFSVW